MNCLCKLPVMEEGHSLALFSPRVTWALVDEPIRTVFVFENQRKCMISGISSTITNVKLGIVEMLSGGKVS